MADLPVIVKICKRCAGTGFVARHDGRVVFRKCPRCAGKGGKRATLALLLTIAASPALADRVTVDHNPPPGAAWFARVQIDNRIGTYNRTTTHDTAHGPVSVQYWTTPPHARPAAAAPDRPADAAQTRHRGAQSLVCDPSRQPRPGSLEIPQPDFLRHRKRRRRPMGPAQQEQHA